MKIAVTLSAALLCLTWTVPLRAGEGEAQDPLSPPPLGETTEPGGSPTVPTDDEVRAAVLEALSSDESIASQTHLEARCREGILTLSGRVETLQLLRQAMGRAGDVRGVIDIFADVRIATAGKADPRIALEVREELLGPTFRGDRITVATENGIVRLVGTTATYARKLLAERTAAEVPGVVEIINELWVAAPPEGDSMAMEQRIQLLLTEGLTRIPGRISVSVRGRTATLEGRVGLYSHRLRAERLAYSVGGIHRVDNRLQIDPALPSSTSENPRVP